MHDTGFDWIFYSKMYPDLKKHYKELDQETCYNHWLTHGMKEGRCPNLSIMMKKRYSSLNESLIKINKYNYKSHVPKSNKLNILIRTHQRKKEFETSIQSVLTQTYKNFQIIISYDDVETYDYVKSYSDNPKITLLNLINFKTRKTNCFFDLYCNEMMRQVNDGWIIFIDDDNYLIEKNCLRIINDTICLMNDNNVLLWKFLRNDKLIFPSNHLNIKFGEIDTCSFCFHYSHKNSAQWNDSYGSDYYFFQDLLKKCNLYVIFLDLALIATSYISSLNHYETYMQNDQNPINPPNQDLIKYIDLFPDPNNIDYADYINHYTDLKFKIDSSIILARKHWETHGKYESRIFKFIKFDYDILKKTIRKFIEKKQYNSKNILVISLYNETNPLRKSEYEIALQSNLQSGLFEKIIVFYDVTFGFDHTILIYAKNPIIQFVIIQSRPSFFELFDYTNKITNQIGNLAVISNADIIHTKDLNKLDNFNMDQRLITLTRWDFIDEQTIKPRMQNNKIMESSNDTWIFRIPMDIKMFDNDEFKKIKIGNWNSDGAIKYFSKENNIEINNFCLEIKNLHIHFCNGRKYHDEKIIF